jgi:sporulation protein YlmC with PRC-barrel domain
MHEFDLPFGADVMTTTGDKAGKLVSVAVNTDTLHVTHLIVEEGRLLKKCRAFPFPLLQHAGETIDLTITSGAIEDYPQYREESVEVPAEGGMGGSAAWTGGGYQAAAPPPMMRVKMRYGVPDERAVLSLGTAVTASDGRAGKLDHFIVAPATGAISRLVLQQGTLFPTRHILPVEMVEAISQSGIFLRAAQEELETLPAYEKSELPEGHIGLETGDQLAAGGFDAAPPVDELAPGADPSEPTAVPPALEQAPHTEPHGAGEELSTRVARALFEDARTAQCVIEVIDERGVVTLSGTVPSATARQAAAEIAAAQPGVISVTNTLRVV